MAETIGEAHDQGWRLTARCAYGNREGMKSIRRCVWTYELDMRTLLATRGRDFPLSLLSTRLRCPACGSRKVSVLFQPPSGANRNAAAS